jgi:Arc/MetJ family transcription regulator
MRTTLNIDDHLLAEAQRATGIDSKTKVIEVALRSLLEQAGRKRLAALHGAFPKAKAPDRRRPRRRSA